MFDAYEKRWVAFQVDVTDCICSSCGRPIFSTNCPHLEGETDEHGKIVVIQFRNQKEIPN